MLRARLWDTTLARRLGVARPQVFRWRTDRAMPSRRSVERLEQALQWSIDGEHLPFDPAEHDRLLVLAGHGLTSLEDIHDSRSKVELPDRCAVYSHRYDRRSWPTQWSLRTYQIEAEVEGAMHCMLYRLPSFFQPEPMMRLYERWYDGDRVETYI
jgi:hypothetical protein